MVGDEYREYGERGWRAEAVEYLASRLELATKTVDNWGADFSRCPETVKNHLSTLDVLYSTQQTLALAIEELQEAQKTIEDHKRRT